MKTFLFLILLILLNACGSSPKVQEQPEFSPDIEKEFSYIENSDFEVVKPANFQLENDIHPGVDDEGIPAQETIAVLPDSQIEKASMADDPLTRIISYCYQRNFQKSAQEIDKNYKKYLKHPAFWNTVGNCFMLQKKPRAALLYYNKAREVKIDYAPSISNIGVVYAMKNQLQKALAAFERASQIRPGSLVPRLNATSVYLKYHQYEKAISLLIPFANRFSKSRALNEILATAYLLKGEFSTSVKYYKRMDRDIFKKSLAGINYGLALGMSGEKSDALDILEKMDAAFLNKYEKYYAKVKEFLKQ